MVDVFVLVDALVLVDVVVDVDGFDSFRTVQLSTASKNYSI